MKGHNTGMNKVTDKKTDDTVLIQRENGTCGM